MRTSLATSLTLISLCATASAAGRAEYRRHDRTVDDMVRVLEHKAKGVLVRLSTSDGKAGAPLSLPAPPIADGLIAVPNRLFACLRNNTLVCLKTKCPRSCG